MFDRRLVVNFDWILLLAVCVLAGVGIVNLFSATANWQMNSTPIYMKQVIWLGGGLLLVMLICCFDYRHLEHFAIHGYILTIGMLLFVLLLGKTSMGATRWINLGFFNLQPSEVIKIVMILLLARIFGRTAQPEGYRILDLWGPALLLFCRTTPGTGAGARQHTVRPEQHHPQQNHLQRCTPVRRIGQVAPPAQGDVIKQLHLLRLELAG